MFRFSRSAKRLSIALLIAFAVGIVILSVVLAEDEPNRTVQNLDVPKIEMPWEQKPGPTSMTPVEIPTATPDDEQAKKLPKVTPPVLPTVQVIDTAPDVSWDVKYEIIIKRAGSNEMIVFKVPVNVDREEAIEKYLNEGDEIVTIAPPPLGGPIPGPDLAPDPTEK